MHNLNVKETDENGAVELGCFSRTDGIITPRSRKNLRIFKQPPPGTNLNGDDYGNFLDQRYSSEGWQYLDPHLRCNIDVQQYDIVAGRNTLVKLGSALYEGRHSFELNAVTFGTGRTLFVSSFYSRERKQTGMQHYWAARFEALCTKRKTVDTEPCFYSILKRRIGRHQVLFYAEIDCKLKRKPKSERPQSNYVELKCRKRVPDDNYNRFMYLYLKYWLQSHLASVPTIVEGVRDDFGKLVRVNRFETEQLPAICKEHRKALGMGWNTRKILDFLEFALNEIFDLCEQNAGVTVRVKFDAVRKLFTADLLPENEFVEKVEGALSRSESKQKRRNNKLCKSENLPVNVEHERTETELNKTPSHHEADEHVEDAHSDPKSCQNTQDIVINPGGLPNRMLLCLSFIVFILRLLLEYFLRLNWIPAEQ